MAKPTPKGPGDDTIPGDPNAWYNQYPYNAAPPPVTQIPTNQQGGGSAGGWQVPQVAPNFRFPQGLLGQIAQSLNPQPAYGGQFGRFGFSQGSPAPVTAPRTWGMQPPGGNAPPAPVNWAQSPWFNRPVTPPPISSGQNPWSNSGSIQPPWTPPNYGYGNRGPTSAPPVTPPAPSPPPPGPITSVGPGYPGGTQDPAPQNPYDQYDPNNVGLLGGGKGGIQKITSVGPATRPATGGLLGGLRYPNTQVPVPSQQQASGGYTRTPDGGVTFRDPNNPQGGMVTLSAQQMLTMPPGYLDSLTASPQAKLAQFNQQPTIEDKVRFALLPGNGFLTMDPSVQAALGGANWQRNLVDTYHSPTYNRS